MLSRLVAHLRQDLDNLPKKMEGKHRFPELNAVHCTEALVSFCVGMTVSFNGIYLDAIHHHESKNQNQQCIPSKVHLLLLSRARIFYVPPRYTVNLT